MNNSFIYVDFRMIDSLSPELLLLLKNRTMEIMNQKFEGTNVEILNSLTDAKSYAASGMDVKYVGLHEGDVAHNVIGSTGEAIPELKTAFVDITKTEFPASDFTSFAQEIGIVASHEAGHLYLPGHSVFDSLMSNGEVVSGMIRNGQFSKIEFTEVQKALIGNGGLPEGYATLDQLETELFGSLIDMPPEDVTDVLSVLATFFT